MITGSPTIRNKKKTRKNGVLFQKQQALQPEWIECGVSRVGAHWEGSLGTCQLQCTSPCPVFLGVYLGTSLLGVAGQRASGSGQGHGGGPGAARPKLHVSSSLSLPYERIQFSTRIALLGNLMLLGS